MKTTYLIPATVLSLLALISCKKDVDPSVDNGGGEKGVITVTLKGSDSPSNSSTKVSGAPTVSTENAVKKGMIFVFRGSGANPNLDGKASFDFTSTAISAVNVPITKGVRQVYVVANIDPANFTSINNLSDLYNVTNKLTLTAFRTGGALAMSGFVNDVDLTTATTVTVPLKFIGSRIHVDWDISNLVPGLVGNVTIQGAAILNVKTASNYLATPITSTTYYSLTKDLNSYAQGYASTLPRTFTGSYLPTGTGVTNDYDAVLNVAPADKGFGSNYTYIFENNSPFPTIVTIYGTYNGTTYYWPIVINGALNTSSGDGTASVMRGNIYNVKANIKGLGHSDPYTPLSPGTVDVTITTATWNPVLTINQDFN